MQFCQDHWDRLRAAIDERGLSHLIAPSGAIAARNMGDELENGPSEANYDPLMGAMFAILNNASQLIGDAGGSPLYLMAGSEAPEDPVEGYGPRHRGRTWPRCPLCYINLAHELTCKDKRCQLDKTNGFDWMIARAADDAKEHVSP